MKNEDELEFIESGANEDDFSSMNNGSGTYPAGTGGFSTSSLTNNDLNQLHYKFIYL